MDQTLEPQRLDSETAAAVEVHASRLEQQGREAMAISAAAAAVVARRTLKEKL
jgi:hypothetical protein